MDKRRSKEYQLRRDVVKAKRRRSDVQKIPQEIQLLSKIYQIPRKQVLKGLPDILPDYPKLSYELYILAATIVSKYIDTWYDKLNSDDYEFEKNVFETILKLLEILVERLKQVDKEELVNSVISILTQVLEETYKLQYSPLNRNIASDKDAIDKYLESQHEIFRSQEEISNLEIDPNRTIDSLNGAFNTSINELDATRLHEQTYLRVLSKNLLITIFPINEDRNCPISSPIVHGLLILLIADLILKSILDKLSDPTFIYESIGSILDKISAKKEEEEEEAVEQENREIKDKLTSSSYINIISAMAKNCLEVATHLPGIISAFMTKQNPPSMNHILNTSAFSLIDHLTGLSNRKPLFTGFLHQIRNIASTSWLIDKFIRKQISQKIQESQILQDQNLSEMIMIIRTTLFGEKEEDSETKDQPKNSRNSKELSAKIATLAGNKIIKFMKYRGETDTQIQEAITKQLDIFSNSKINRLISVKLLDEIILSLFPEMSAQ